MKSSRRYRPLSIVLLAVLSAVSIAGSVSAGDEVKWASKLQEITKEMDKNNNEVAEKALLKLVQKYPEAAAVHVTLGRCFKKQGKLNEAKAEFRAAIEVEPNFAEAHYELGCMLESDRQYMAAAESFERYLQLNPDAGQRKTIGDRIRFCRSQ